MVLILGVHFLGTLVLWGLYRSHIPPEERERERERDDASNLLRNHKVTKFGPRGIVCAILRPGIADSDSRTSSGKAKAQDSGFQVPQNGGTIAPQEIWGLHRSCENPS